MCEERFHLTPFSSVRYGTSVRSPDGFIGTGSLSGQHGDHMEETDARPNLENPQAVPIDPIELAAPLFIPLVRESSESF